MNIEKLRIPDSEESRPTTIFNPYAAKLSLSVCHSFKAGSASAISSFK